MQYNGWVFKIVVEQATGIISLKCSANEDYITIFILHS